MILQVIIGVFILFVLLVVLYDLKLRRGLKAYRLIDAQNNPDKPKHIPFFAPDPILGLFSFLYEAGIKKESETVRLNRWLMKNTNNKTKSAVTHIAGVNILITWNPEMTKEILYKDKTQTYIKGLNFSPSFDKLMAKSVLSVEGEEWKRQRKILNPSFHFEFIKSMTPTFLSIVNKTVQIMEKAAKQSNQFEPYPLMSKMTLDVIGKAGFGFDFKSLDSGETTEQYSAYSILVNGISDPLRLFSLYEKLPLKKNREWIDAHNTFRNWATKLVNDCKELHSNDDNNDANRTPVLLDLMVQAHDDAGLNEIELFQNIFVFFLAGHETTSGTLTAVLHFLAKFPDIQERCFNEINEIFHGNSPDYDSIKKLNVVNSVISESMRLLGPVRALIRSSTVDCELGGYFIPKDTFISIQLRALQIDPTIWGDDATEFSLDRWTPEKVKQRSSATSFIPFGGGPRSCLGTTFAQLEMRLALVIFLQKFEFTYISDWESHRSITEQPKPGFKIGIKLRK